MSGLTVPGTMAELAAVADQGRFIAGGTDLLVQHRGGDQLPPLVDLSNLADAPPPVAVGHTAVTISALAPISRIVDALDGRLPGLAVAAAGFGSLQIRNRATIGGNIANASPAADMVPPLVAAEAIATLAGPAGERRVPVADIAVGPGTTRLSPGEWIATVEVPLPDGEEGFAKLGGRAAMAISIVCLAWRWRREDDGTLRGVRLAFGAVAPTVVRAREAEEMLEGGIPDPATVEQAIAAVHRAISPIDDVRASAWYRREMAGEMLRTVLASPAR